MKPGAYTIPSGSQWLSEVVAEHGWWKQVKFMNNNTSPPSVVLALFNENHVCCWKILNQCECSVLFPAMVGCEEYGKVNGGVNSRKVQTLQVSRMKSFSVRLELMFNF